jgi:hypothetical protein
MMIPCIVKWRDAHLRGDAWVTVDQIEIEDRVVHTVGWLIEEKSNDGYILMASNMLDDDLVDTIMAIPVAMVVEIRRMSEGNRINRFTDKKEEGLEE